MNILYYSWGENSTEMSARALKNMGHKVSVFDEPIENKLNDEKFEEHLVQEIKKNGTEIVITYNYIPCITSAVERTDALYGIDLAGELVADDV